MVDRAFPVVFAASVERTAAFYEALGFERHFRLPEIGEPGYVGLRRGSYEVAVVRDDWPQAQYQRPLGDGVRFEMFVYVENVDDAVNRLVALGAPVLRAADDMPWGERVAYVSDPDGNPVAVATR